MEDENSSHAVAQVPPTPASGSAGAAAAAVASNRTTHTPPPARHSMFHTAHESAEESPSSPADGTPVAALTEAETDNSAVAAAAARCASVSNEEEAPLVPPPTMAAPTWAGISATPPSTQLGSTLHGPSGGVASLFPTSAIHGESTSTPAGQSLHLGRDLSNRHPPTTSYAKPRTSGLGATPRSNRGGGMGSTAMRTGLPVTYIDSSNSESISNLSLGGGGVAGPHRSLFRSMAPLGGNNGGGGGSGGGVPLSPVNGLAQWGHGAQLQLQRPNEDVDPLHNISPGSVSRFQSITPGTPMTPSCSGNGEAVLVREPPPPPTPLKQRRTIHPITPASSQRDGVSGASALPNAAAAGSGGSFSFVPRLSSTTNVNRTTAAAASTNPYANLSAAAAAVMSGGGGTSASPLKVSTRQTTTTALGMPPTSPSLPRATTPSALNNNNNNNTSFALGGAPSLSFKFHKREGSRKRSADVLSQFSALDLDETPATPYGQTLGGGGRVNSLGTASAFPSQPSASMTALRGGHYGNFATATAALGPTSPLLGGYATPVTLSQQIGGSNTFSQLLLHPSQDVLDMSQADTECSNFLARRIVHDYNEVRLLGRGSFGTVSLYKEISSGEYVAVKMSPPLKAPDMERRYRRERSIMGMVRGMPHVVQLSAAWEEGRVPRMYLQLEYCPGGSLAALAAAKQSRNEPWAEEEVKVFLAHMSIALDALHRANIAHVDFKPDNVLLDKDGAYKLSDFGCSVLLDSNGRPRAETQNGYGGATPSPGKGQPPPQQQQQQQQGLFARSYGSPTGRKDAAGPHTGVATAADAVGPSVVDFNWTEGHETSNASVDEGDCRYLCADMLNEKRYFKAGDMFSLGMSLYELMSGQPLPRNGDHFLALRREVPVEQLRRRGYSQALIQLVVALLHSDPTQRPTARQVLQYLRPSPSELQLLADPSAVQQWTTSATTFSALAEQPREHEEGGVGQARQTSTAGLGASVLALRCVSALLEGSSWLFTTTQQDVHHALSRAASNTGGGGKGVNDEEAEQQQQQQQTAHPRVMQCPQLPMQRRRRGGELEADLEDMPMSPIVREEACTPTTLNY